MLLVDTEISTGLELHTQNYMPQNVGQTIFCIPQRNVGVVQEGNDQVVELRGRSNGQGYLNSEGVLEKAREWGEPINSNPLTIAWPWYQV